MVSAARTPRAICIGVSGGLGVALPLAAYALTVPFSRLHDMVGSSIMPLGIGALAGVGLLAASEAVLSDIQESDARAPQDRPAHMTGVPMITRAVDAPSEAEAWRQIDEDYADGTPMSCDPVHAADIYRLALEELNDAASRVAGSGSRRTISPDATTVYMSCASAGAGARGGAAAWSVEERAYVSAQPTNPLSSPSYSVAVTGDEDDLEFERESEAARIAAMNSLFGTVSAPRPQPAVAAIALDEPDLSDDAPEEVPMADYSGHEQMWAAALSVLDEEPATSRDLPSSTADVERRRMEAVVEGGRATTLHGMVNEIVEQELAHAKSASVRESTHRFLSVVQGNTATMPRLAREA